MSRDRITRSEPEVAPVAATGRFASRSAAGRERLAAVLRRIRPPDIPRTAPGSLPPLRSWSEGRGHRDLVVFAYRGVSSAEVEMVAGAMAGELEATVTLAAPEPGPVVAVNPARMVETLPLDRTPQPFALVVPGGLGWRQVAADEESMSWLREAVTSARGVIGVSTGTLLLAAAGLIEGDEAAGHWLAGDLMEELGVRKSPDRVVQDRLLATASGALAGAEAAAELARAMRFSPWGDAPDP